MKKEILFISLLLLPLVSADTFERVDTNVLNVTQNATVGSGAITHIFNGSNGDFWLSGGINQTITGNINRLALTYMRGAKIRSLDGNGYYTLGSTGDAGLLYYENQVDHSGKFVYMIFNLTTETIDIQNPLRIDTSDLGLLPDDPIIQIQDGSTVATFTAGEMSIDSINVANIINGSPRIEYITSDSSDEIFINIGDDTRTISGLVNYDATGTCGGVEYLSGLSTSFTDEVVVGDVLTIDGINFDIVEIVDDDTLKHGNLGFFGINECIGFSASISSYAGSFVLLNNGRFGSSLIPNETGTYSLGNGYNKWKYLSVEKIGTFLPISNIDDIGSQSSPYFDIYADNLHADSAIELDGNVIHSWDEVNQSLIIPVNLSVDVINYNASYSCDTDNLVEGQSCWNADDMTLNIVTGLGNVHQVGQEIYGIGINKGGRTLLDGSVVALSGSQGDRFTFIPADSSSAYTSSYVGVLTVECVNNAECPVTVFGDVRGLDTSMWSVNDSLYMNCAEPGNLTNVIPTLPCNPLWVGSVKVSHANQGVIGLVLRNDPSDGFLADSGYFTGSLQAETLGINAPPSSSYWLNIKDYNAKGLYAVNIDVKQNNSIYAPLNFKNTIITETGNPSALIIEGNGVFGVDRNAVQTLYGSRITLGGTGTVAQTQGTRTMYGQYLTVPQQTVHSGTLNQYGSYIIHSGSLAYTGGSPVVNTYGQYIKGYDNALITGGTSNRYGLYISGYDKNPTYDDDAYAIWVDDGDSLLDGDLNVTGNLIVGGNINVSGCIDYNGGVLGTCI